jgi:hypothetical protein
MSATADPLQPRHAASRRPGASLHRWSKPTSRSLGQAVCRRLRDRCRSWGSAMACRSEAHEGVADQARGIDSATRTATFPCYRSVWQMPRRGCQPVYVCADRTLPGHHGLHRAGRGEGAHRAGARRRPTNPVPLPRPRRPDPPAELRWTRRNLQGPHMRQVSRAMGARPAARYAVVRRTPARVRMTSRRTASSEAKVLAAARACRQ